MQTHDSFEPPKSTQPPVIRIGLRRLPTWTLGLTFLSAISMAFVLSTLTDLGPKLWAGRELTALDSVSLLGTGMWLMIWLLSLGKRLLVRRFAFGPIEMSDDAMQLPTGPESIRRHTLLYKDITSVIEGGSRYGRHFFIESPKRVFHLPQSIFAEPQGAEVLLRELRGRLGALPEGPKRLLETELKRRAALSVMKQRPWATQALLGLCGVFFVNTWLKGGLDSPFGLLRWGANAQALVAQGDWWRPFAANFLHGFLLHAAMNALALWYLGNLLERLLGWQRFVTLYLASGAVAMIASSLLGQAIMSVGASGAIFGLLGGFAVVSWRLRDLLPLGFRQSPRWWLTMVGINILLPLIWRTIDLAAHATGFVVGATITFVFLGRRRGLPQPAGRLITSCAALLIAVFGVALAKAVAHAADTSAARETEVAQLLLADPRSDAETLNRLAWRWVIDPDSQPEHLDGALASAREAAKRDPSVPEYHGTEAAALRRLNRLDESATAWLFGMEAMHVLKEEGEVVGSQAASTPYALQLVKTFELIQRQKSVGESLVSSAGVMARHGNNWFLTPTASHSKQPGPFYALVRDSRQTIVGVVRYVPSIRDPQPWVLPAPLIGALQDIGATQTGPVWQHDPWPFAPIEPETWALWRLTSSLADEP